MYIHSIGLFRLQAQRVLHFSASLIYSQLVKITADVETKRVEQAATAAANNLGFTQLKELQMGVIVPFVVGRDVFGVLPTGYGKSLATWYTYCTAIYIWRG